LIPERDNNGERVEDGHPQRHVLVLVDKRRQQRHFQPTQAIDGSSETTSHVDEFDVELHDAQQRFYRQRCKILR
jgi:hypothetical protein